MTHNSSKSSEGGNTISPSPHKKKQISPAKKWCFTLNNWTEAEYSSISSTIKYLCDVAIVGKEISKSGTPHLQGYLEFKVKCRPQHLFTVVEEGKEEWEWPPSRTIGIHWEKAKGNRIQNVTYCSKEDKKPFTLGCKVRRPVPTLEPDQLYNWQKDIVEVIEGEPDGRTINWYYSHAGGIGKTCFCKFLSLKYGAICLHGKGADVRNGIIDYYNRNGDTPEIIIYPIPRCHSSDYISYEALEQCCDMYFYSGKYEGGMVNGAYSHVIVFANEPPVESKMSNSDTGGNRWHIVCIDPENAPEEICEIDSLDC